uniref:Uncharacterized protein n=1 Tax=Anguilla anguilla TaxID=7936 RepID=A0A0E9XQV1_ANGAN
MNQPNKAASFPAHENKLQLFSTGTLFLSTVYAGVKLW